MKETVESEPGTTEAAEFKTRTTEAVAESKPQTTKETAESEPQTTEEVSRLPVAITEGKIPVGIEA